MSELLYLDLGNGVFLQGTEIIIAGDIPDSDTLDENDPGYHNCDQMGCNSIMHCVLRRDIGAQGITKLLRLGNPESKGGGE